MSNFLSPPAKLVVYPILIKVTLHGLRHTQATALIDAGVPVKAVSERLGHSNVQTTLNIYTHVLPQQQEKILEISADLLAGKKRTKKTS